MRDNFQTAKVKILLSKFSISLKFWIKIGGQTLEKPIISNIKKNQFIYQTTLIFLKTLKCKL